MARISPQNTFLRYLGTYLEILNKQPKGFGNRSLKLALDLSVQSDASLIVVAAKPANRQPIEPHAS